MFEKIRDRIWLKLWMAEAKKKFQEAYPLVGYPMLVWLELTDLNAILETGGRQAMMKREGLSNIILRQRSIEF